MARGTGLSDATVRPAVQTSHAAAITGTIRPRDEIRSVAKLIKAGIPDSMVFYNPSLLAVVVLNGLKVMINTLLMSQRHTNVIEGQPFGNNSKV